MSTSHDAKYDCVIPSRALLESATQSLNDDQLRAFHDEVFTDIEDAHDTPLRSLYNDIADLLIERSPEVRSLRTDRYRNALLAAVADIDVGGTRIPHVRPVDTSWYATLGKPQESN